MSREGLQTPPPVAQITIAGALSKEHIVALVDVAMNAGAALMVQPRSLAPAIAVIEAAPPARRALPAARAARKSERRGVSAAPPAADDRVRRALADGPLSVADFLRVTRMDKRAARQLVDEGVIVATGVTRGRRYALPGHPAKEAP